VKPSLAELHDRQTRQTDAAIIGNNSLHLMHLVQPKNAVKAEKPSWVFLASASEDWLWWEGEGRYDSFQFWRIVLVYR